MADSKLSNLTAGGDVQDADLFYSVQGGAPRKVTAAQIKAYAGGRAGGGIQIPTFALSGSFTWQPGFAAAAPQVPFIGDTAIDADGPWLQSLIYLEESIVPPDPLTSLASPDLRGLIGDLHISAFYLTSIQFSELVFVGGQLFISDPQTDAAVTLLTVKLPNLTSVAGDFQIISVAITSDSELDLSGLTVVGGGFNSFTVGVTHADLSSLVSTGQDLSFQGCPNLVSVDLSSIVTIGGGFDPNNCPELVELNFDVLEVVGANFTPNQGLDSLVTINLPALVTVGGRISMTVDAGGIPSLTTFTFGSTLKNIGGDVVLDNVGLDEASVDNTLVRLAALDGTVGTTSYDNHTVTITGTSSPPSATGLAAITTLEGRNNTVTVNS